MAQSDSTSPRPQPALYFDLGSPYAYLAVARAADVLGAEPHLEPVLVGGIFAQRGRGSWAHAPERAIRIAEVEGRARRYGLEPIRWPDGWPNNTLKAMRATVWAGRLGAGGRFARAAFRSAFAEGQDLSSSAVLAQVAASAELPADQLAEAVEDPTVKEELKLMTLRAWERGVVGVPCLAVGEEIFYGDDRLEAAAERAATAQRQTASGSNDSV